MTEPIKSDAEIAREADAVDAAKVGHCKFHANFHAACPQCLEAKHASSKVDPKPEPDKATPVLQ